MWRKFLGVVFLLGGMPRLIWAAELLETDIARDGRHFVVNTVILLRAQASRADQVLNDYTQLTRLNSAIRKSVLLSSDATEGQKVRAELHACVWFFCKDMIWEGRIRRVEENVVEAETDPKRSSFKAGTSRWSLVAIDHSTTRFEFTARFTTSFWVPPLIGDWVIKRKLQREVLEMSENIERFSKKLQ